ncbi:MAG TPA: kelch repeat-containing protein [Terriglobales bacterium]|nr:kelch repeat-containing protein [Terriglobales bacterium]
MAAARRIALASIPLLALLLMGSSRTGAAPQGQVAPTGSMHDRRADHSATLLKDGRVLIAGGMVENGVFLSSAELFDPATGRFAGTGDMLSRRVGHSATLLPNGKVLIAGGLAGRIREGGPGIVASTEIYDPQTGRFTPGPNMSGPRTGHAAVVLADHKVLIAGGADHDERTLASAEIYDPASNRFTATASMHTPRLAREAVLLKDGRVLVTGGGNLRQAEIFDPKSAAWQPAGEMTAPRMKHAAALLPDGRVLVVGGSPDGGWNPVRSVEVFDPQNGRFTPAGEMEFARFKLPDAVTRLKDGNVLVAGGADQVELYQAASGRFVRAGSVEGRHYFASATLLPDGRVLIAGGYGPGGGRPNGPLSTQQAWIYRP